MTEAISSEHCLSALKSQSDTYSERIVIMCCRVKECTNGNLGFDEFLQLINTGFGDHLHTLLTQKHFE